MASLISSAASFLFLCFLISASATAALQHRMVAPAWRVDLRPSIGGVPLPYVFGGRIEAKNTVPVTSLWFTDNDTVVATFVISESQGTPKLSRHDDVNVPLRLRAIFVAAASGKITATHDWPSDSRASLIVTTQGGKTVTQTGDELTLYDSDLKKLKSIKLPPSSSVEWGAIPSPTGKNILLEMVHPESKLRLLSWLWVQTDTLDIIHSWDGQPNGVASITDDKIVLSTSCVYIGCEPTKLEVRGVSTDWTVLGAGGGYGDRYPRFVTDDVFLLRGGTPVRNDPVELIRTSGDVLFIDKQPSEGGIRWNIPVVSAEGTRFVAPGVRVEGSHPALDIDGHSVLKALLVYDLPGRSQVLDVKGPAIRDSLQFAISPDGSRLAVLNSETVQMFELPPLH